VLQAEGRLGLHTHRGPAAERAAVNPSAAPGGVRSGLRHAAACSGFGQDGTETSLAAACYPSTAHGSGQRHCGPGRIRQHRSWSGDAQQPSTHRQGSCTGEQARPAEPGHIPLQSPGREGTGTRSPVAVLACSYSQPQTDLHLGDSFARSSESAGRSESTQSVASWLAARMALAPIPNHHISTRSSSPAVWTRTLPGESIQRMLGTSPHPAHHQQLTEQFVMLSKLEIRSLPHAVPARDRDKLLKKESASFMPDTYLISRLSTCSEEQRELAVTVCSS